MKRSCTSIYGRHYFPEQHLVDQLTRFVPHKQNAEKVLAPSQVPFISPPVRKTIDKYSEINRKTTAETPVSQPATFSAAAPPPRKTTSNLKIVFRVPKQYQIPVNEEVYTSQSDGEDSLVDTTLKPSSTSTSSIEQNQLHNQSRITICNDIEQQQEQFKTNRPRGLNKVYISGGSARIAESVEGDRQEINEHRMPHEHQPPGGERMGDTTGMLTSDVGKCKDTQ